MKKQQTYLSWEQVKKLLPVPFNDSVKLKGTLYSSSEGDILFYGSKKYEQNGEHWWYSIDSKTLNEVKYVLLSLGFQGVLLVPAGVFLDYKEKNPVRYVKGGREIVSIYSENRYVRRESKGAELDLTRYFIPWQV